MTFILLRSYIFNFSLNFQSFVFYSISDFIQFHSTRILHLHLLFFQLNISNLHYVAVLKSCSKNVNIKLISPPKKIEKPLYTTKLKNQRQAQKSFGVFYVITINSYSYLLNNCHIESHILLNCYKLRSKNKFLHLHNHCFAHQ